MTLGMDCLREVGDKGVIPQRADIGSFLHRYSATEPIETAFSRSLQLTKLFQTLTLVAAGRDAAFLGLLSSAVKA